jgi:hypothetical protein
VLSAAAVQTFEHVLFADDGTTRRVLTHLVDQDFFDVFAMTMAAGRATHASEHAAKPPRAVTPPRLAAFLVHAVLAAVLPHIDPLHADWFFGTDPSIPRWTGYAVGFELVRAYLDANPGRRASALVGEPATSFVPYSP